jgi:threonyl-tRNA synthetase
MNLPERFDMTYIDSDGEKKRPVMLHRVIFGSVERFIGILIEHYAGAFPLWLAPVQIAILGVNGDLHGDASNALKEKLNALKFRAIVDNRNEKLGYRLREAQVKKIPIQVVIGDGEVASGTVNVRRYGKNESISMPIEDFIASIQVEQDNKL